MKERKSSFTIIIAVFLIFCYIFYECYSVTHVDLQTQTATISTVYQTVETSALIVRNEKLITTSKNGVIVPAVLDGDKVGVKGKIADVFSSSEIAENNANIKSIQKQIEYYDGMESKSTGQVTDIESMDSEIVDEINSFVRNTAQKDFTLSKANSSELNDLFTRRQLLIGETIDFSTINKELRNKEKSLMQNSYKPSSTIKTNESGYFASYTDGYETLVNYNDVENLTIDDIKDYSKQVKEEKTTNALGKLIVNYRWYLAAVVNCDDIEGLQDGDTIEICLKDDSNKVLEVTVVSGAQTSIGAEQTALILKCNQLTSDLTSLRLADIEIRLQSFDGIKLPATAVHVVDGTQGVYALVSNQIKFRKAEVEYTCDDYVVVSYNPDDTDGIVLYDQIITKGKDLSDGSIYT